MLPDTSQKRQDKALKGDFPEIVRPNEGENIYRLIVGPNKVNQIWYPYMSEDPETKEPKVRFAQLVTDRNNPPKIIEELARIDGKLAREVLPDKEKYYSPWIGGTKYQYLGFNRQNSELKVEIIELPYSIVEALKELQAKTNGDHLRYGLLWMYDVIVTKTIDPKKPKKYGTSYSIEVDIDTLPKIKVPVSALYGEYDPTINSENGFLDFFTQEELDIMEDSTIDLDKVTEPYSEEKVMRILESNPPLLNAERWDKPVFMGLKRLEEDQDRMEQIMESIGLTLALEDGSNGAGLEEEVPDIPVTGSGKRKSIPGLSDAPVKERKEVKKEVQEEIEEAEVVDTKPPKTEVPSAGGKVEKRSKRW